MNPYQQAIVRNAGWFLSRQREEGYIDADGDEFYGVRGDATLVGHAVSVRVWAHALTGEARFLESARRSLDWLAARQDAAGGWKDFAAFTLDAAQCVFEGFNTYQALTGDTRYLETLTRAADRMVAGTLAQDGELALSNVIEIGEYAHFCLLAWKTTGAERFRRAADAIVGHISRNFDSSQGYWLPYDASRRASPLLRAVGAPIRWASRHLPLRGRIAARMADRLLPLVVGKVQPQYGMSLMDAEALLDTLDGSCSFPELRAQASRAVAWAEARLAGPFPGTIVESIPVDVRDATYPLAILNDTQLAATWPTACLLLARCALAEPGQREAAKLSAEWLVSVQAEDGAFFNFQRPDGTFLPLQSGNVNFYASLALWTFNEIFGEGPKFFTRARAPRAN